MANYLDPYASELQGIQRQQEMAKMLLQQGQQQPQEQMVSGRVAPINPLQAFLPALNTYQGMNLQKNAESEQKKLADLIRGEQQTEIKNIIKEQFGSPDYSPAVRPDLQRDDQGNVMPNVQEQVGTAPNIRGAYERAALSQYPQANAMAAALYGQLTKQPERFKLGEGETYNEIDKNGNFKQIASGGVKPRAFLHFDTGSHIEIRDPNDPTKIIARLPKGISPNEAIRLADEGIGAPRPTMPTNQVAPTSPIITPSTSVAPNAPNYAKDALSIPSKTIEQPKFDVPQPPSGLSAKQTREWFAEASKPLTGDSSKKVSGAIAYQQALDNYKNIISNFSTSDMADPNKRALLNESYNTVTLTGKEAYNLGVLNGGDERILNGLAPNLNNPTSLLTSKNTVKTIADNQKQFAANVINNEYKVHQKIVPQNLRDYVTIKQTTNTNNAPANPNRAFMGTRPIVVKNGAWVYEDTGKAVQ